MGEFVSQSVEEMLPELEQMERVGLFTKHEIRQILKKRTVFEYKLRRKTKGKEDFLQYIQYQTNMLALVKKRRERTGYTFKKLEIDIAIVQSIHRLFNLVLYRFPDDVKLWLTHIAFCKQRNEKSLISRLYTKMLQVHDKKPDLWVLAAKWEFEDNNNTANARSLLQRALRFNAESKPLWLEYYRLELLFAEKMRKRKAILGDTLEKEDEIKDQVLQGQVAFVVYREAIQTIPDDVNFLLSFLPVCQLFEFTKDHEDDIYNRLQETHPNQPLTWDMLAKRSLGRESEDGVDPELVFHKVYEEAVTKVPSAETWSLYIKACLDLVQQTKKKALKTKRIQRALLVLEEARDAGHLTAELWDRWIELLCDTGSPSLALDVAQAGTETHPTVVSLWKKRLFVQIVADTPLFEVQKTLKDAQKSVPQKESWPLIQMVLDYSVNIGAADDTVRLLESSMISCPDVSGPAKELYLEREYQQYGIQHARKIYSRISQFHPVPIQFYKSYISMEMAQSKAKMKFIRRAYQDAVREHGETDPDLWLDYIKMETKHPRGKPESIANIHFRAVKCLSGSANQEFLRKYSLLQTS